MINAATGDATIPVNDPHGSNVTVLDIPAGSSTNTACVGIDGWTTYTEYGGLPTETLTTPPSPGLWGTAG